MILGIEIGGTKLQLAVGHTSSPELSDLVRLHVDRSAGAQGILRQIEEHAPSLIERYQVKEVGIGFGGPVDVRQKRVITSHHVAGWDGIRLGQWCESRLGSSLVEIDNDCNAAALAEARFGAGQGCRRVFYVTVGTGIGGGLVIDGQLYGSDRPGVAEIGHLRPGLSARQAADTVESYASGSGIECQMRNRLTKLRRNGERKSECDDLFLRCEGDIKNLSAEIISKAAYGSPSNPLAVQVLKLATDTLGWAIAQMSALVSPDLIVLGGGVTLSGAEYMAALQEAIGTYLFPPLRDSFSVRPAALGERVVVNGSILLCGQT